MLGPLPPLHRVLLVITVLVVGIAAGAWVAHAAPAVAATAGAGFGAVAGLLLGVALVHDFSHHHPQQRPVRTVRRH